MRTIEGERSPCKWSCLLRKALHVFLQIHSIARYYIRDLGLSSA
jgi:hypothetical protein